ncbi:MAG: prepilin-type N-terminal cleavage/methylation domain-containing protein [Patescibacteria group bacterium]
MMGIKDNAFTLVELLIVISIIVVLSIIGYAAFNGLSSSSEDSKRNSDINAIGKAYEVKFDSSAGLYHPLQNEDFAGGQIPTPPEGGQYSGLLASDAPGFQICAALKGNPGSTCSSPSPTCFCKISSQGVYIPYGTPYDTPYSTPYTTPYTTPPPPDSDGDGFDATADCNDNDADVFQNVANLKKDQDQDNYTVTAASTECVGTSVIVLTRTYYKDIDGVNSWLAGAGAGTDCYDKHLNARPNQTGYLATTRGTSALGNDFIGQTWNSFDYNCNGSEEPRWPQTNLPAVACYTTIQSGVGGYITTPPACGVSGTFRRCSEYYQATACPVTGASCNPTNACENNCTVSGVTYTIAFWSVNQILVIQSCR